MVYGRNASSLWCFSISWTLYCLTYSDNKKTTTTEKNVKKEKKKSSRNGIKTLRRYSTSNSQIDVDDNFTLTTMNDSSANINDKNHERPLPKIRISFFSYFSSVCITCLTY